MRIGKLYFGWGETRIEQLESLYASSVKEKRKLEMELMGPRNLGDAHDREVLLKYFSEKTKDELEALSLGLDHHWQFISDKKNESDPISES